jgi:CHAD domain-containing protein
MLLGVGQWLASQAWAGVAAPEVLAQSVAAFAEAALSERHKRVRKRGKHLIRLSPEERHAVRIAAKKLRYAAEFFASLFGRREAQPYLAALSKLQDLLGQLNDAATTAALLAVLGHKASNNDEHHALGVVRGWTAGHALRNIDEIELVWQEFKQARRFW